MRYSLHPEAAAELREAAEYYRERAGNPLSQALFEDFERSINVLLNNPELGAARRYGKRHYDLKRFPYSVVYTISGQEVWILAVAHQSRRPGYWRRRK